MKLFKLTLFLILVSLLLFGGRKFSQLPAVKSFFREKEKITFTEEKVIYQQVFNPRGYQSKIRLGNVVKKLIDSSVIDETKFNPLISQKPEWLDLWQQTKKGNSQQLIVLNEKNAQFYLNVLWPLGLANYLDLNKHSPINDHNLANYASTGGWTLGKLAAGGDYFNQSSIVPLTTKEEILVQRLAQQIYRPCCDNHTFYQDCNHGSAMLGLLELGVSQGLTESELLTEALKFNSYWFKDKYLKIAQVFVDLNHISWTDIDPKVILSEKYSSASGWQENVEKILEQSGYQPEETNKTSCSFI